MPDDRKKKRSGRRNPGERAHTLFNPPSTAASDDMADWRVRLNDIIFEADTHSGRLFDILLLWLILVSVAAVMLESVTDINAQFGDIIRIVEWTLTIIFTVEYILRLICVSRPAGYAVSFFGVIDLLSVLPTYLSLIWAGSQALIVIRVLRLLRVFRLFKLSQFENEAKTLVTAILASREKIAVFLSGVLTIVVIIGAVMYLVEGAENGFTNIPRSIYWSIVTLTTVGYGDIAPKTPLGQAIAALVMILGYAIIAVPTGIVSVELAEAVRTKRAGMRVCAGCGSGDHEPDALHCKLCGKKIEAESEEPPPEKQE